MPFHALLLVMRARAAVRCVGEHPLLLLGGSRPAAWLLQLEGPRQMSRWHLSGEAEGGGDDTGAAKSLVWQ